MTDRVFPCLWFDGDAEEAVTFYVSLVPDSRIVSVSRYGEAGPGEPGSVLTMVFELAGRRYMALNGGADFPFSEAVSLVVQCDTQDEIDRIWGASARAARRRCAAGSRTASGCPGRWCRARSASG